MDCVTVRDKVDLWLKWDQNASTRNEIERLKDLDDVDELRKLLSKRMTFGTAGLRGAMKAGFAFMNDLVIIQTSQGLAKYILDTIPDATTKGVVVSYDARHNSERFARLTAQAFLQLGIPVYLFNRITPTPYVPFAIVELKAAGGVMVTASHNPKEDNGYKVYWNNGAQIISPHDKNIQKAIENNLEPWSQAWKIANIRENHLCKDPTSEIHTRYMSKLEASMLDKEHNLQCRTKIVFTAMHGVAHQYMETALKVCGFQYSYPVEEQKVPDPDFPTVRFPNPEEGESALDLSIATANNTNSQVILANDPDADRLAVAERIGDSRRFRVFNGNEIGVLLGYWAFSKFMQQSFNKGVAVKRSDLYMIASTVSSKFLESYAKIQGFTFEETLTGFKWMANRGIELQKQGKTVLFAFEEAIGYMCGTNVWDKDGVSAAMNICEMLAFFHDPGRTLAQQLNLLYDSYGYHVSNNSYYLSYYPDRTARMFQNIRDFHGTKNYPTHIGHYAIKGIRDLTTGFDSTQPNKKPILPVSSSSEMITFYMQNGATITLRTSGTEPKIKWYSEIITPPRTAREEWPRYRHELDDLINSMVQELYQPEGYGFVERQS